MIRFAVFVLALFAPLPAVALSCLAPTVERSYARADAAKDAYVIVHGRLTLDDGLLPKGISGDQSPPEMTKIKAILLGKSFGRDGFKVPFDHEITLEVACFGPWCGALRNGEDVLAFLRKDGDAYALDVDPCGGFAFTTPKRKDLQRVQACMTSRNCTAER